MFSGNPNSFATSSKLILFLLLTNSTKESTAVVIFTGIILINEDTIKGFLLVRFLYWLIIIISIKRGKMKIVLNIQKKHLFIFIILLLIIGVSVVFGALTEWQNAGNPPSHDTLWTSAIESKSSTDTIAIRDNLIISSGKGINLGGVLRTAVDSL